MLCALFCAFYWPPALLQVNLSHETRQAPTGLRLSDVVFEPINAERARLTVTGRYNGYDKGRVYFDVQVKKGSKVLGTGRDSLTLVPRESIKRSFIIEFSGEADGCRVHFTFDEIRLD